jgi:alanyl-tRNA synthetase
MPLDKKALMKELQKKPERYWRVRLFKEKGFVRRQCKKCGKFFWTLTGQDICNDSTCRSYDFIGNPPAKKKLDYFQTWKVIEHFFRKNGHTPLKRYPTVCRWFPLYFTVAGIVDFYRMNNSDLSFEFPANPSILTQPCLRFNDIVNTGINGKSYTSFLMVQQSSLYDGKNGYWKDECIDLDFRLLTEVFGIKQEEVVFIEDAWLGPSAFGSSLEYHVQGLELGNAVFTEFAGTLNSYKEMKQKVIDMGGGLERFCWITQGTPTSYDAVFGPVLEKLKKVCGIEYDKKLFNNYARFSGTLNLDEVADIRAERKKIAKKLDISLKELESKIAPMEALYTIADHSRTLLFAITDGGIPSNLAGGYNLRVVLRRALGLIERFGFPIKLTDIIEWHADYLRKLFPELGGDRGKIADILSVEEERYRKTKERAAVIVQKLKEAKKKIRGKELLNYYDSEGIPPEELKEAGLDVEIPADFYSKVTEMHMKDKEKKKEEKVPNLPETELLFHQKPAQSRFRAKVLFSDGNKVVLDRTLFYPESGGQAADHGFISDVKVTDVQTVNGIVFHTVKKKFRKGDVVEGVIDFDRRRQLMQHHTAVHIINGAARVLLGEHIWQAGSGKTEEKAHLDITHYKPFSEEELVEMEKKANEAARKNLKINKLVMERPKAEERFGFRIYQGGVIPKKELRIVDIPGVDVEACGGLHCDYTGQVGKVLITSTDRIQDGVNRITLRAGKAAEAYIERSLKHTKELVQLLEKLPFLKVSDTLKKKLEDPDISFKQLRRASRIFTVPIKQVKPTVEKFSREIVEDQKKINRLDGVDIETIRQMIPPADELDVLCGKIFELWKSQKKKMEKMVESFATVEAQGLVKKARGNKLFEIISADRKELIEVANALLKLEPDLTVVLANQSGDVVGMSNTQDMGELVKRICEEAGGAGGGRKDFAQGKGDLSKLLRVFEVYRD